MHDDTARRWMRAGAIAGVVGPLLLAGAIGVLSVVQYDFMRSLRWHPIDAPTTDWPSGLALGPHGDWMTATFIGCGVLLMVFAHGMRHALPAGSVAPLLLMVAGGAMIALAAPTDPTYGGGPRTPAGYLHDAAYVTLALSLLPAQLILARDFGRDPRWRRFGPLTIGAVALIGPAFALKGISFYLLLIAVVIWFLLVALRLGQLARR